MPSPEPVRGSRPHFPLPVETVVVEEESREPFFWIDGFAPLPIGARIELNDAVAPLDARVGLDPEVFPNGSADAVVIAATISALQGASRCLVLTVRLLEPGEEGSWMLDFPSEEPRSDD